MSEEKTIQQFSDRELQEAIFKILVKQERHQNYHSTVITGYIILTFIGIIAIVWALQPLAVK